MYKDLLAFQAMLDQETILLVEKLQEGSMTKLQFHSKKKYLKNKGDLCGTLRMVIAWEIWVSKGAKDAT